MTTLTIDQKKTLILDREREMASVLAIKVLDKPKPPLWMIFIPVFFVFFAQKMGQYKSGLRDFADNYLQARRRAMDKALEILDGTSSLQTMDMDELAHNVPDRAKEQYRLWMAALIEHYTELLQARGDSYRSLVRTAYQTKTNFLLAGSCLTRAENAYNLALLPGLDGDSDDLLGVIRKMESSVSELRRQEAEVIFS